MNQEQPVPRESLALSVRSPTWLVLSALATRVEGDGTVRVVPAALARTLGMTTQNVLDAIAELVERCAVSVVAGSACSTIVLDISTVLKASSVHDSS